MIHNLKTLPISVLFPSRQSEQIEAIGTRLPFEEELINQLDRLSHFLMANGRSYPNIVAAGYWLRKSHLLTIKADYPASQLKAKGTVFHIAPGNVDSLFFYSMMISVLCGNQTILRVSNEVSTEAQALLDLLNKFEQTLEATGSILSLLTVIQYPRDDTITAEISSFCNGRVIWGGDKSIAHISQFPLVHHSDSNICFPDRYSVAVIQIKDESMLNDAVEKLLRDIKPYYQQACSSPKVVYWLNTARSLQDKFWLLLDKKLNEKESLTTNEIISQLLYSQRLPLLVNDKKNYRRRCLLKKYDLLQVAELETLSLDSIKSHPGLWALLNLQINDLDEIKLFEHCQTVTISGVIPEQWQHWQTYTEQPMKRIVPAGQALAFSHIWDGVDLIEGLSKLIKIY